MRPARLPSRHKHFHFFFYFILFHDISLNHNEINFVKTLTGTNGLYSLATFFSLFSNYCTYIQLVYHKEIFSVNNGNFSLLTVKILLSWSDFRAQFWGLFTMYNVHCKNTMYAVICTIYNVHCKMYNVQCKMHNVQCTL